MYFGFLGTRGLNEFLNEDGAGFYFTVCRGAQQFERFFPNVGQSLIDPPRHLCHRDDPAFCSDLRLEFFAPVPFQARFTLLARNRIAWSEQRGVFSLSIVAEDELVFHPVGSVSKAGTLTALGPRCFARGLELGRALSGQIEIAVAARPELLRWDSDPTGLQFDGAIPADPAAAAVCLNLTLAPQLSQRLYVPVNKVWPGFMGRVFQRPEDAAGPLLFAWDGAFASIILAGFDSALAQRNLLAIFEAQTADGRVPQIRLGQSISNRSGPPVWFLAARTIFEESHDLEFLKTVFPLLLSNYLWFKKHRMNPDGTFSWGTDNENDQQLLLIRGKAGAVYESGMDDSPLYDSVDMEGGKLAAACIDLSSLMYCANEILLGFAAELRGAGEALKPNRLAELRIDRELFRRAVHRFFDFSQGSANSFSSSGGERHFLRELTPVSFYPLLTDALTPDEVALLERLFYSPHFQGEFVLPSLSFCSALFDGDGDYWRGRIWPPQLYLTAQGFKRYAPKVYEELRERAQTLLRTEWQRHGHVHENYSALTGQGEPRCGSYARSCPLYSWGGLLGVL